MQESFIRNELVDSERRGGRRKKTAAYALRCKAYYFAIEASLHKASGNKPSPADINRIFGGAPDSKNWYSYRAGKAMPEGGSYKRCAPCLRQAIDTRIPSAPIWRDHGLFRTADPVYMDEREVHRTMYALSSDVSREFFAELSGGVKRLYRKPDLEAGHLIACRSIDALAAAICLFRESLLRDNHDSEGRSLRAIQMLLPLIDSHDVLGRFAGDLKSFIGQALPIIYRFRSGVYVDGLV